MFKRLSNMTLIAPRSPGKAFTAVGAGLAIGEQRKAAFTHAASRSRGQSVRITSPGGKLTSAEGAPAIAVARAKSQPFLRLYFGLGSGTVE